MTGDSAGYYVDAMRKGRKDRSQDIARGGKGILRDLEELLEGRTIVSRQTFPLRDIPVRLVDGTVTKARAVGFSPGFLPVMGPLTEFAAKWRFLCDAHMAEGFHHPVKLVEFMGRFYAEEGNKRVSVLKYFHVNSVRAETTRMVPEYDASDPDVVLYYEFMEFHRKTGMNSIHLTTPGRYDELYERLAGFLPDTSMETFRHFEAAEYEAFRRILHRSVGIDPRYSSGDILLVYLRLFGMPALDEDQDVAARLQQLGQELQSRRTPEGERVSIEPALRTPSPGGGLLESLLGPRRPLRVGFLYAKTPEASQWTRLHDLGRLRAIATLGKRIETEVLLDVPESMEAVEPILGFLEKRFDVVFATSPALLAPTLRVSIDHPEVRFYCCSEARPYKHVETYFGRMFEARFLIGLLAGTLSRNGLIGCVATLPVPDVVSGLNAFALGVRTVNPRAEVRVEWTGDWESHSTTGLLAQERHLFESGCELVSRQNTLSGRGLSVGTGLAWGGCLEDTGDGNPPEELRSIAAPVWNWGVFYERILGSLMDEVTATPFDVFQSRSSSTAFWWGLGSGIVDLSLDTACIPATTRRLIEWMRTLLVEGRLHPFTGPLRDDRGELRVADGEVLGFEAISRMDWFVEGIRTTAPVMSQEQAEDVAR